MPRKFVTLLLILALAASALAVDRATEIQTLRALQSAHPGVKAYLTDSRVTRLYGKPFGSGATPQAAAEQFIADFAPALGAQAADLRPVELSKGGAHVQPLMYNATTGDYKFNVLSFAQYRGEIPVFRSKLKLLVRNLPDNPLVLASAQLYNLGDFAVAPTASNLDARRIAESFVDPDFPSPASVNDPQLMIWAGTEDAAAEPTLAVVFDADDGYPASERWLYVVEAANGKLLHKENRLYDGDVNGIVSGMATEGIGAEQCEDEVNMPMPYVEVSIDGGPSTYTNESGAYNILYFPSGDATVVSPVKGEWFEVFHHTGTDDVLMQTVTTPANVFFTHNQANTDETERAQVNAYIYANLERDYVLKFNPSYPTLMNTQFPIYTNRVDGYCPGNAWYDPGDVSLNFCLSGGGYPNTAWTSVIFHEYGHHLVEAAGSGQGQYGEGFGDVMSVLMLDSPSLGWGFYGDCGSSLRTADNSLQYPCAAGIHECGQVLSGCVWDLREELAGIYPGTYMDTVANLAINANLVHTGTQITPQITIDYLTLDDDDANLDNGSPHWEYICAAFSLHNMDCPALQLVGFTYPNGQPEFIAPNAQQLVRVEIGAQGGTPTPGSAQLHYSINGAPFVTGTVTEVSSNVYDLHLPATTCQDQIDWYLTVETAELQTIYDPAGAPASTYSAVAALNSAVVASDDFESNQGWTVSNSGGLSDGAWNRGTPVGGGDRGDPPTDYDGSGQCYLTDNVDDNSDVDDGTTSLISPTFDLSAGNGRIHYARWYSNTAGSAPSADSMEIWISNDDGGSWVKVETVGPIDQAGGGWYTSDVWAGDYVTPTAQMKMKFDASDLGSGSVVEAAVDEFSVTTYECEGAYLCGDADGNGFVNITDAVTLVAFIFGSGAAPDPMESGDFDCDELVNISDAVAIIAYIFSNGPAPCSACN